MKQETYEHFMEVLQRRTYWDKYWAELIEILTKAFNDHPEDVRWWLPVYHDVVMLQSMYLQMFAPDIDVHVVAIRDGAARAWVAQQQEAA